MEKEAKTKKVETVKKIIRKKRAPVRFKLHFFYLICFFFKDYG